MKNFKRVSAVAMVTIFASMVLLAPAADARFRHGSGGTGAKPKPAPTCYDLAGNKVAC